MRIPYSIHEQNKLTLDLHRDIKTGVWEVSYSETNLKNNGTTTHPLNSIPNGTDLDTLGRNDYKGIYEDGYISVVRFADLHRHSDNSLLDGISKVPDMVEKTEYAGALTDHGKMYGFLEYYKEMKKAGKKPIIGFEAYVEDMDCQLSGNHLVLLAKNNIGYKNLLKLTSESFENFKKKPHVTWEMLRKYHEGIICTSACMGGVAQVLLAKGHYYKAKAAMEEYIKIFGDDYYVEIQRHGFAEEEAIMRELYKLAQILNVKVIATIDSHYTNKEDSNAHEIMLCMQTKKTISDPTRWAFSGTGYHIHSSEEMEALFADMPEALDNTLEIADKCDVDIKLNDIKMPDYEIPEPFENAEEYFEYLANEGFKAKFHGKPQFAMQEYRTRLRYEMETIKGMGFSAYFIIVWDFINYARTNNIYVGPGRGSAAGSLIAYCMEITDLDPIKYNLLFERFLNPERVSMPDIDIDFEHSRREEVIEYLSQKYGSEHVCRIVTFGTEAAKMVLKDVSRVLDMPGVGVALSKMVPEGPGVKLGDALDCPDFKETYEANPDAKRIVDIALTLEGCKRHASQHACGCVIAANPVHENLPTSMEIDKETGEKAITSQVVMTEVEELGLLKMDLLGLKNMTVIHDVIDNIKTSRGVNIDYHDIPLNDRATYKMLSEGRTGGVFQLESSGMTSVVTRMLYDIDSLPDDRLDECFERMIAAVALFRPGPMDYIDDYINGMWNSQSIVYDTPELEPILKPTYGVIVYQEQVMQIVRTLAGYSLGRADLVRRAMGKKSQSIMDAEKTVFLYGNEKAYQSGKDKEYVPGCIKNGIRQETAEAIWDKMGSFAKYAFNRSHAACYAYIAILTAYMRCHWTTEFYAAMLDAFILVSDKMKAYLIQAIKEGIEILPPDINLSEESFISADGKTILFGLSGLSGVKGITPRIIKERNTNGSFKSIHDFCSRMIAANSKLGKSALDAFTWSGALSSFGHNKRSLMAKWPEIITAEKKLDIQKRAGQLSLFGDDFFEVEIPKLKEHDKKTLMEKERKYVGFYLTEHPVDELYNYIDEYADGYTLLTKLEGTEGNVKTLGMVSDVVKRFTRKGREMYSFNLCDRFSSVKCVVFPKNVKGNFHHIQENAIVVLTGKYNTDSNFGPQIIVSSMLGEDHIKKQTASVCVSVSSKDEQNKLLVFTKNHPGKTQLLLENKGIVYNTKRLINLNAYTADWLKQNFKKVS